MIRCSQAADERAPTLWQWAEAAAVRPRQTVSEALETGRSRLIVAGVMLTLAFLVIGVRLVDATALSQGGEPARAQSRPVFRPVDRADIVDRNGMVLATSLATASLYADARLILDPAEAAGKLTAALPGLVHAELVNKLDSDRRFIWLKRHLTPRQHAAVHRLGVPGLAFQREERRFYPPGPLISHIVGYTGVDNKGLAGLEQSLDSRLQASLDPVDLSIDLRIQHKLKQAMIEQIADFRAIGGAGLVVDLHTAEILAMVSLPDFDPHTPGPAPTEARFNRNTLGVYEMGSTFKIFNTALALESGQVSLSDSFDARHPIRIGRFTINDFHGEGRWLTVSEIFKYSSNIGSVKMALHVGTPAQRAFMRKLGLLRPVPVEVPEAAWPLAPSPWREINTMTISYGHGISVSPLHLVTAAAAIINGGILRAPTLLKRTPGVEVPGERVISERTSQHIRQLLRTVVQEGTASKADVPGYLVGGKTGTAEKPRGRHYSRHARLSSFLGAFPMHAPRLIVFVMIDEPKGNESTFGYATGGWVAAPVVGRLIREIGPMLGIDPVDETRPEVRQAMAVDLQPGGSTLAAFRTHAP